MQEHPSTNGGTGHANERVHASQKALVHYAVLHPGGADARHVPNTKVPVRRYGLHARELLEIRRLVREATCEALTHENQTPEWVAERVVLATERALFAIGVEAAL